jgi:VIT1/CCC1 family predicted Fe2+/Mn2+ transporter
MQPTPDPATEEPREPVLSTVDRVCELCFGLFMALTFVGAVSAATGGADPGRTLFVTALGCNVAWGLADAVMYLVRTLVDRARRRAVAEAIHADADAVQGVRLLRAELTGPMSALVDDRELETVRARLAGLPELPQRSHLEGSDYLAAAGVFVFVLLGTFPVALPFLLLDTRPALLVSRLLTLVILFACGLALGRHAGGGGWKSGLAMTMLGVALTAAIIALGG